MTAVEGSHKQSGPDPTGVKPATGRIKLDRPRAAALLRFRRSA